MQPAEPKAYVAGYDIGTVNFADLYATQRDDPDCPLDQFPYVLDPIQWRVGPLSGSVLFEWNHALVERIDAVECVRQNRVRDVRVEQQLAQENPVMYGISSCISAYYETRRRLTENAWPETITSIGAAAKFGAMMLKCPEGNANKRYRKQLSIRIVWFLLQQWGARKLICAKFVDDFKRADKKDDLADVFLMTYMAELQKRKQRLTWEALGKMIRYVTSEKPFGKGHKCPLEMSAEGSKRYAAYKRKKERQRVKAAAGNKRKRAPDAHDATQRKLPFAAAATPGRAAIPLPRWQPSAPIVLLTEESLEACENAAERHSEQAVMRKRRGAISDSKRVPELHRSELDDQERARTVHLNKRANGGEEEELYGFSEEDARGDGDDESDEASDTVQIK
jgi:hypothetical protein